MNPPAVCFPPRVRPLFRRPLQACLFAAAGAVAAFAVPTRVQWPLTVNEVPELGGYFGERWQANRAVYLHQFDIEKYLRLVERREHRDWWWAGEQDGKWLESAVLSSAHSDEALRRKARSVLERVIVSQEPDGYVGVTARDVRSPEKPLRGMDPYELYFKLHALITAHEQWGDTAAIASARRLADYFVNTIGPGKAEFWPGEFRPPENHEKVLRGQSAIAGHAVHYSWEGTLLIDPMLRLAQITGDRGYGDWSRWVVDNIDRWSGWDSFSKLERVAAGTMGIHEVQPYVHSHTFQMNFLGFLRLYELTGDPSYLRKVAGVWRDVASRQMYITGGVSVGEHYEAGHVKPVTGHVVETCASMSWLQVTQTLLELTGDVVYADAMERLLWNHVFASQSADGDTYRYHTPPNGVKPEGYYHGPDCCTSSGHRLVSLLPTLLYGKDERGVFINQYTTGVVEARLPDERVVRLRQETLYPEKSDVRVVVEAAPGGPFAIRLRLPGWCENPRISVNGKPVSGARSGTYVALDRVWSVGDEIRLELPMELAWVRSDAPWRTVERRLPGGEIMHEPVAGDSPPWALVRGPVVYAVDTLWWGDESAPAPSDAGNDLAVVPDLERVKPAATPPGLVGPAFEASFMDVNGRPIRTLMVPFTNIGHWHRADRPRPGKNEAAQSYAIWLQSPDAPVFAERMRQVSEKTRKLSSAVDYVLIGDAVSELAHQVDGGSTGGFRDATYRHGAEFGYTVKVPAGRSAKLVVTYWGGDVGRVFDVTADGRLLRTQRLERNRPGEFYEETYTLPEDMTAGRTDAFGRPVETVNIRFRGRNGSTAGGVFGLRTE